MREPYQHAMMPRATHDELGRQNFVASLRIHVGKIASEDKLVYERKAKPAFVRLHNRPPQSHHEVRRVMKREATYQMWSALKRTSKEMLWDVVGESIERQLPALIEKSKARKRPVGSLNLDPTLEVPRYLSAIDIHEMPGSYHTEIARDDVYAGALYDRGGYYEVMSLIGEPHQVHEQAGALILEGSSRNAIGYLKKAFPDLRPARILDMGCAIGSSSLPYVRAFPQAEVYALDISGPQLRYGHARAEALGTKIHFSQQNAECTDYPDGYFDIVATHAVVHETSGKAVRRILRECHRLLRAGGVSIHSERKFFAGLDPHEAFLNDWDTYNDNEPFKSTLREMDPRDLLIEAGFDAGAVFFVGTSRKVGSKTLYVEPGDKRAFGAIFGARKQVSL
jgi:2-polyprenyl-3-methyl-5-hydroxy-6-metoxy-1,4-benzoquinol methylase